MLAAGAGFVARVFADSKQVERILEEAFKYKGFAFIEVIQPCLIFHKDIGVREKTYSLDEINHDYLNMNEAMKRAEEWNYNSINSDTKIPLGIFYKKERRTLEENFPQLKNKFK
jgi:2-oxoglutarate ferredoxin oxidoreductase subunit beta